MEERGREEGKEKKRVLTEEEKPVKRYKKIKFTWR